MRPAMLMLVVAALGLTACPSNDGQKQSPILPEPSAVTVLPKDDPCQRADVRAFGKQCGADCRANNGGAGGGTDLAACYKACDEEIARRCKPQ